MDLAMHSQQGADGYWPKQRCGRVRQLVLTRCLNRASVGEGKRSPGRDKYDAT
jgi:hypothetical protein